MLCATPILSVAVALAAIASFAPTPAAAATCESLSSLLLPNTTITSAETVKAGAFTMPANPNATPAPAGNVAPLAPPFGDLPAFCRVAATLKPTSDSDIKIEVWLPIEGWNNKFLAVGNGG